MLVAMGEGHLIGQILFVTNVIKRSISRKTAGQIEIIMVCLSTGMVAGTGSR